MRYDLAIVGAGILGLGHALAATRRGLKVVVIDREAEAIGVEFFQDADDFCERHPDVVVLATSILSAGEGGGGKERERGGKKAKKELSFFFPGGGFFSRPRCRCRGSQQTKD